MYTVFFARRFGLQKQLLNLVVLINLCRHCLSSAICPKLPVVQKLLSHMISQEFVAITSYLFSLVHTIWLSPSRLYKSEQIASSAHLLSLLALFLLQHCLPKQRNSNSTQLHQNPTLTSPSRGSSDRILALRLPLAFKPFNFSHQQGLILAALRD